MSSLLKRTTRGALLLALISGLVTPLQAQALTPFLQREATQWGHVYAGPNTTVKQSPREKVAFIESKSKFVVNYKNFPEWAKRDFQAAADEHARRQRHAARGWHRGRAGAGAAARLSADARDVAPGGASPGARLLSGAARPARLR